MLNWCLLPIFSLDIISCERGQNLYRVALFYGDTTAIILIFIITFDTS